jgi:hypothetical protein
LTASCDKSGKRFCALRPSTARTMSGCLARWLAGKLRRIAISTFGLFEPGRSLLDHAGLVLDLEELLGRKADVVTEGGLYWLLRRRILKEARAL